MFLKSKDGSIVAVGYKLPKQNMIHGHHLQKKLCAVLVEDVVQVGAKTWFLDNFGEMICLGGLLLNGHRTSCHCLGDPSPLCTRSRKH